LDKNYSFPNYKDYLYEVVLKEGKTKAYEVMVYKNSGQIIAEMGPNMYYHVSVLNKKFTTSSSQIHIERVIFNTSGSIDEVR